MTSAAQSGLLAAAERARDRAAAIAAAGGSGEGVQETVTEALAAVEEITGLLPTVLAEIEE